MYIVYKELKGREEVITICDNEQQAKHKLVDAFVAEKNNHLYEWGVKYEA
ncbi:hypothetical protein M3689_05455 [Alkalihalophilus marmarensis]|nr:hypothetical protein [Alkalihalophilus marmarensis]MCM3488752.1 hypothetical protein [Alkalihalophilus marmarensis]